jgi:hypothetical protein
MSVGHETGHGFGSPPVAFAWAQLVDHLAREAGGLSELSRHLQDVAPASAGLSDDPMTVERGLRRLRTRSHAEGNKYGRLLLRCYGLPGSVSAWAKEMGQYHSRSSDLPVALRADQLRLWDRPPVAESLDAVWVHLGLAMLAHRKLDLERTKRRASLAQETLSDARPAAAVELLLLQARLASDIDTDDANRILADTRSALDRLTDPGDKACYAARWLDQRAYQANRGWRQDPWRLTAGLALYDQIPEDSPLPFVRFRRAHGRAFCLWKLRHPGALHVARTAVTHAGDGGFIRFRIMALSLQAHIEPAGPARTALIDRAMGMAASVGDTTFLAQLARLAQASS